MLLDWMMRDEDSMLTEKAQGRGVFSDLPEGTEREGKRYKNA